MGIANMNTLVVLCPTYRRPACAANILACFLAQRLPEDWQAWLYLLDDSDCIEPAQGVCWVVESQSQREPSLPAKYNAMVARARARWPNTKAFALFDDDDIYLPDHLTASIAALEYGAWCKPSVVWSTYHGLQKESAAGRFHGSLAVSADALGAGGGWPASTRQTFDQEFMARLAQVSGDPVDTIRHSPGGQPTYVFRWADSQHWHGQHFMHRCDWYQRVETQVPQPDRVALVPRMDEITATIYRHFDHAVLHH